MINQYQVQAYLLNELPETAIEFKKIYPSISILKAIQCLFNYTTKLILRQDLTSLKKCFIVANTVYVHGNPVVRNAIETVYLHPLSLFVSELRIAEKNQIHSLMPLYLYKIYYRQNLHT